MRAALLVLLLAAGCGDDVATRPEPSPPSALIVLNGLGENLSRIDLETGAVTLEARLLGSRPNALLFDPDSDRLFAANSDDNDVWSLQPDTLERNGTYALGPNTNPYALAITASGELAVTGWLSGDVTFFDVAGGGVRRRVPVGRTPQALLALPGQTLVTLVHYDLPTFSYGPGEVAAVPDGGAAAGDRVRVGLNPQDLLVGPDGLVHVVCTGDYQGASGRILFLDPVTLAAVDSTALGGTPGRGIVVGDHVYVSAFFGGLMKYDGLTHEVLRGPDDPVIDREGLGGLAYDAGRARLYVAGFVDDLVFAVDVTADTLAGHWPVGDGPQDIELVTRP